MSPSASTTLAVGVLALVLSACSVLPWVSSTPDAFTDRTELPTCGVEDRGRGAPEPSEGEVCLVEAMTGGTAAELAATALTDEGDAIRSYYRTVPGVPGLVVYVDGTDDSYGSQGWALLTCPDATAPSDLEDCSETSL